MASEACKTCGAAAPEPRDRIGELVRRVAAADHGRGADWPELEAAWPFGAEHFNAVANAAFDAGAIYEPVLGRLKGA